MSCFTEKDPRDFAYVALYIAICWYKQLTPEQAWLIVSGRSAAKPGKKLTPEILEQIKRIIRNPNFKSFENIEQRFRVNRYDVFTALKAERKEGGH